MEKIVKKEFPKESVEGDRHTSRHNEYEIDIYKLVDQTQELPEVEVLVADYLRQLDEVSWTDSNENRISPREVIEIYNKEGLENAMATHPELRRHLEQLDQADYSHPILIFNSNIIDGSHRLAKAHVDNRTYIKAKVITEIPQAAIIKIHDIEP